MSKEEKDQRTNAIISRLEALSIESNDLLSELRETQRRERPPGEGNTTARTLPHSFVVGDRAIITNNYLRQRNIQGRVIYATAQRVTIIDTQGHRYTRKPTNLRKLSNGQ
jgi:hypothetical protein